MSDDNVVTIGLRPRRRRYDNTELEYATCHIRSAMTLLMMSSDNPSSDDDDKTGVHAPTSSSALA